MSFTGGKLKLKGGGSLAGGVDKKKKKKKSDALAVVATEEPASQEVMVGMGCFIQQKHAAEQQVCLSDACLQLLH